MEYQIKQKKHKLISSAEEFYFYASWYLIGGEAESYSTYWYMLLGNDGKITIKVLKYLRFFLFLHFIKSSLLSLQNQSKVTN